MNFAALLSSLETVFVRKRRSGSPITETRPKNPRRNAEFEPRKTHFLQYIDPSRARGLEIGPLDLPMIEPDEGHCDFADYHSTDELRRMAAELEGTNPDFVPYIDYVTAAGYDAVPRDYDWIAACHVIEHIPDMIGWLRAIGDHLKAGGILFLAIPSKHYTFDVHRRVTTLTEALDCHEGKLIRPSFSQVFDFFYFYATGIKPHDIWAGRPPPPPERNFAKALEAARIAQNQYYDVHCSVFTPESFETLMREMIDAALIPYQLLSVRPTARKTIEFSAVLRRV